MSKKLLILISLIILPIANIFADANTHLDKGVALFELGKFEEAITEVDLVIKYQPDDVKPYYNKGIALKQLDRKKEADEAFSKAEKLEAQQK